MDLIAEAVRILRDGGLVAFPTETVYGLGADATHAAAVRNIFAAKGRPATNPVIVHVADETAARRFAGAWPDRAAHLAQKFWPGPLTLVVPRGNSLVPEVSAGRNTVGLRAPDHPIAQRLLQGFDGPIAAPSANRSTRVSPTLAQHVRDELGDAVDLILDGGPCTVGIESTVLDLTGNLPIILRQGAITQKQIESKIGAVQLFAGSIDPTTAATSPGQHAIHYAPSAPAYRFERGAINDVIRWSGQSTTGKIILLRIAKPQAEMEISSHQLIEMPADAHEYARRLYAVLRDVDVKTPDAIFVEMPPDELSWAAVRDRLTRATKPFP